MSVKASSLNNGPNAFLLKRNSICTFNANSGRGVNRCDNRKDYLIDLDQSKQRGTRI